MIVLDASAGVESLISPSDVGQRVRQRIRPLPEVHVPELFDLEVMSAVRRFERSGTVSEHDAARALVNLGDLRVQRWRHQEIRADIWRRRHRHSIYDAAYIALAKLLDLPLVTTDSRLAEAAGDDVAVELLVA